MNTRAMNWRSIIPALQKDELILAADIGATKADLALVYWNGTELVYTKMATYRTRDFTKAIDLLDSFLEGSVFPRRVCLAVAGPVSNGEVVMTNIGWTINAAAVALHLGNIPVQIVNDLEAAAHGLSMISSDDLYILQKGSGSPQGNLALIAPGTGLGEAGVFVDGSQLHPIASEGGHCGFAPSEEIDTELFLFLKRRHDHVSWERVLSGPGISAIYDFLVEEKEAEEPSWLKDKMLAHDRSAVISANATACKVCADTMRMFFRYLAIESGNLVLKFKATGGLYISGGIVPKLLPLIDKDAFARQFSNAGRMSSILREVPVRVVTNQKLPLMGAAMFGLTQASTGSLLRDREEAGIFPEA